MKNRLKSPSCLGKAKETVHMPGAVPSREQHQSMHSARETDFTELVRLCCSINNQGGKQASNRDTQRGGEGQMSIHIGYIIEDVQFSMKKC